MAKLSIMLVEDNPDDELLTLRELRKQNIANEIIVMRGGAEALDYLELAGKLGADGILAKPIVRQDLMAKIEAVIQALNFGSTSLAHPVWHIRSGAAGPGPQINSKLTYPTIE